MKSLKKNEAVEHINVIKKAIDATSISMVSLKKIFIFWAVIIAVAVLGSLVPALMMLPRGETVGSLLLQQGITSNRVIPGIPTLHLRYPPALLIRIAAMLAAFFSLHIVLRKEKSKNFAKRLFWIWLSCIIVNLLGAALQTPPSFGPQPRTEIVKALMLPFVNMSPSTGLYQIQFFCFSFSFVLFVTVMFTNIKMSGYLSVLYLIAGLIVKFLPVNIMKIRPALIIFNVLWILPFVVMALALFLKQRNRQSV